MEWTAILKPAELLKSAPQKHPAYYNNSSKTKQF